VTGCADLAERCAAMLAERGAMSGTELAGLVGARKAVVLDVLRSAPRFERVGRGPSSAWRLTGTGWEPMHGDGSVGRDHDVALAVLDRLGALERELAEVKQRLAELERHAGDDVQVLDGQLDLVTEIANTNGASGT
jgi:hypothetical protein